MIQPEGWIGIGLCCLAGLFSAIFFGVICAVCVLYRTAVEILKTPFLLLVSAGAWIYNGFVGFVCLFKNVGKDDILVSDRYQDLRYGWEASQEGFIKELANITVPGKPEKAQKVSSTKATLGYIFGFYDVKSKIVEKEMLKMEYIVKPKSFPYRTGGYMIY